MPKMSRMMKSRESQPKDAISLLKEDHRKVEKLFEEFESATRSDQKERIAEQICTELMIHATIEEEIFYPSCRGEVESDLMDEAYVEHDSAKVMIAEILESAPDEDFYDAKVKTLAEEIRHHVKEEEKRSGVFSQAKSAGLDMDELGERLAQRKAELKAQFKKSGLPAPETRTMCGARLRYGEPVEDRAY